MQKRLRMLRLNVFKVNNKDTIVTWTEVFVMSLLLTLKVFREKCSTNIYVFFNLKQIFACWDIYLASWGSCGNTENLPVTVATNTIFHTTSIVVTASCRGHVRAHQHVKNIFTVWYLNLYSLYALFKFILF